MKKIIKRQSAKIKINIKFSGINKKEEKLHYNTYSLLIG